MAPETPGSIHEGGELGYSLSHAFGAVFDNPDLLVACVVGDGEAETGPLATSWHSNKFLNPVHDGAVLPILHLNGYKIASPTVLARIPHEELEALFRGYGYTPYFVEGDDPTHDAPAHGRDARRGRRPRFDASSATRASNGFKRAAALADDRAALAEGLDRAEGGRRQADRRHVPLAPGAAGASMSHPGHLKMLEEWLRSYRPEELFDANGRLMPELAELAPQGERRMGANPHANGGLLLRDLRMPDFRDYAVDGADARRAWTAKPRASWAQFLRDVATQTQPRQLPRLQSGRDGFEPLGRRVRGDRTAARLRRSFPTTITSRPTAA